MTSESPVCNVVICELFCPKIVMQGLGPLSTKTDATLNWNHLGCERPCVVPHQKGWANSRSDTALTNTKPEFHGSLWGNISVQSHSLLGWASEWREGQSCPGWTVRCEPQSHLRQEAGSEEEQIAIVSTGQRGAMCLLLLASLSEILAFYDTGHTCMYRHPQRHVDTCKDIKAHTHSLCLFFLPCRKPWRRLICEHVKH